MFRIFGEVRIFLLQKKTLTIYTKSLAGLKDCAKSKHLPLTPATILCRTLSINICSNRHVVISVVVHSSCFNVIVDTSSIFTHCSNS